MFGSHRIEALFRAEASVRVSRPKMVFAFTRVAEGKVPVFHPDAKVWEVTDRESGKHIGLWYLDPFARPGKRSGAWATSYRSHESFDGERTVLGCNNSNIGSATRGLAMTTSQGASRRDFHECSAIRFVRRRRRDLPPTHDGIAADEEQIRGKTDDVPEPGLAAERPLREPLDVTHVVVVDFLKRDEIGLES